MMLPTAASVQYDRHFYNGFYVSANAVLGVPWMRSKGIQRPSSVAIVPRWEIKRLEVAVPLSMAAMQRPTWGLMLRLNSIVIGSDNLGPLLFRGDIYGSDVYVHIKYSFGISTMRFSYSVAPKTISDVPALRSHTTRQSSSSISASSNAKVVTSSVVSILPAHTR